MTQAQTQSPPPAEQAAYRKKLIEVALPLEAINKASAREKSIRHGHPSTLHLWWARRPLAAARAVIFAQMVDDPSSRPEVFPTEKKQEKERQRLFKIMEDLVLWENTTNEKVLKAARDEIWASWRRTCADNADHARAKELFDPEKLPAFHDPFAGGGALPLEAQRLGLESYASDLNPVAVLINKAMIEIPPRFAGQAPVNPESRKTKTLSKRGWEGAKGLAEDVRYYGNWMREEAEKRIGGMYPKIEVTEAMARDRPDLKPYVGRSLVVIAWLWARTVRSPNPAVGNLEVPLASTFMLSTKAEKEAYVEPVIENGGYRFTVQVGKPKDEEAAKNGTSAGKRAGFVCLMSGVPISYKYVREEGRANRMGARLMAVVAAGDRGRVYLAPTPEHETVASKAKPEWKPDAPLHGKCRVNVSNYGLDTFGDLFTARQLVALTTFSELVGAARERIRSDALSSDLADGEPLRDGGKGAAAYSDAVATYLSFALSKSVDGSSTICRWMVQRDSLFSTFSRQALPMTWDFAEVNVLADCTRSLSESVAWTAESIEGVASGHGSNFGAATQTDAVNQGITSGKLVSTDPPYYDNIGYADLSDFFYVWLRRSLRSVFPDLFATLAVPKAEELVATPYRHGGKDEAETFFLEGMTKAMQRLSEQAHPAFPVTIYYAFKQSETTSTDGTASTGWETFLDAVMRAGFAVDGTWPVRTERGVRSISMGTNALASSIVLVCRKRGIAAESTTRREFISALKRELPEALETLQQGNVAPVDLPQSTVGPGMAIFSRYKAVLEADGKPMRVKQALQLINQALDEFLSKTEGDLDTDTRAAVTWFEQNEFRTGQAGDLDSIARARNTTIQGLEAAGIFEAKAGKARLLPRDELREDWDPMVDSRLTIWECTQYLIKALEKGESEAGALLARIKARSINEDAPRALAYRLYTVCERRGWAQEARVYNELVASWPHIQEAAVRAGDDKRGLDLFHEGDDQ